MPHNVSMNKASVDHNVNKTLFTLAVNRERNRKSCELEWIGVEGVKATPLQGKR